MDLDQIQQTLRDYKLDGWLFFDHHRRDPLAYRILGISNEVEPTRRWYYFIPFTGEPRKLVHCIEGHSLDGLPGFRDIYSSWVDQQSKLQKMLAGSARVAMQYSPRCAIPYVSMVDAGTIELVRDAGVEIVSSADLVQLFEAKWTKDQFEMHLEAGKLVDAVRRDAFRFVSDHFRGGSPVGEYDVQQFIRKRFSDSGLVTHHGPIVAVNANASDPHYEPNAERSSPIQAGDLLLIDLWAKLPKSNAVYYDITWTGFCGDGSIPDVIRNVFRVVVDARKKASDFVIDRAANAVRVAGYEVDDVARGHIRSQGFGEFFFHRTGHSIGTEVHGTGANMDNLESHDDRQIIPNTCFSIEPGIYLPEFGIRSEVNIFAGDGWAKVTGEEQQELVRIW
ncbi:MAG TPA: M24 family metallopeptidase [Bryobacteraceae bacterium]|jgi:Xaa-Pro aminopeptidase